MQWQSFRTCPVKNISFKLETSNQFFFNYHISFQDMQSFFEFLVSVINHNHINELHLFCESFEWFCLQISGDKIFFLSCPRHCNQGLIVVVYYFQIWNKNEHTILAELLAVTWYHVYWFTLYLGFVLMIVKKFLNFKTIYFFFFFFFQAC